MIGKRGGVTRNLTEGMSDSQIATLALSKLRPAALLNVIEAHLQHRSDLPGFALEEMANRLGRQGHMMQREAANV